MPTQRIIENTITAPIIIFISLIILFQPGDDSSGGVIIACKCHSIVGDV